MSEESQAKKGEKLHEGKAKVLFATDRSDQVIQYFKDDATAFNGEKKGSIADKGVANNVISYKLMTILEAVGIPTHMVAKLDDRNQLVKKVEIIPLEVVVRNIVAGSMAKRLGIKEGTKLPRPVVEFYYKDDALDDPLVTLDHVDMFGWATEEDLDTIFDYTHRINDILIAFFANIGVTLVDYKLEYGKLVGGEENGIVLADEISPDSCRLWDMETGEKLDKDRFRRDMGGVAEAYQEVVRRMGLSG
ncbi:MAG: phosphoribosylaminoimidazolesuccinocarboxamide synthase [Magnetococcales bacterium]|nr:phosphoribosylaminoimidazolesuccinocarboxamide synthase [Magnetococcales bacterium]